jgi:hypothetical protein
MAVLDPPLKIAQNATVFSEIPVSLRYELASSRGLKRYCVSKFPFQYHIRQIIVVEVSFDSKNGSRDCFHELIAEGPTLLRSLGTEQITYHP